MRGTASSSPPRTPGSSGGPTPLPSPAPAPRSGIAQAAAPLISIAPHIDGIVRTRPTILPQLSAACFKARILSVLAGSHLTVRVDPNGHVPLSDWPRYPMDPF
eukprot:6970697-Pyramimonas_sp.AAC.1